MVEKDCGQRWRDLVDGESEKRGESAREGERRRARMVFVQNEFLGLKLEYIVLEKF